MDRALRKILATLEISTNYFECEKLFSRFSAVVKKIIAQETAPAELLKKYILLEEYIEHTKLFPLIFNRMKEICADKNSLPRLYFEIENAAYNLSFCPEKSIETARQIYIQVSNFPVAAADKKICNRIILKFMQVAELVEDYFGYSKEAERLGKKIFDFANENFQDAPNILYDVMTTRKINCYFHGDFEMCAQLNRDILNFCIENFGRNHPITADEKYNLILSLNPENDAAEILQLTDDLRRLYKKRKSSDVARSLGEISEIIFYHIKNYPPKYNSLLKFLEKNFYAPNDFRPPSPQKILKENLREIKKLRLQMRKNPYNSSQQIEAAERLIRLFIEVKNFDKVAALQKKFLRNATRLYGKYSEEKFYFLNSMRLNLQAMERLEDAENLQRQMLAEYRAHFETCAKDFGENSLETFKALKLYLLASGFYDFGKFPAQSEKYYSLYKKSCAIAENLFSAGSISRENLILHLDIFVNYLLQCLNRPAEAVKFQEKIVQFLREVDAIAFSPSDFHIHWTRLINRLKELGRTDDAQKISEELQALQKKYW